MAPAEPLRFPRPAPPAHAGALATWIDRYATQAAVAPDRVRRLVAFELLMAAFEAAAPAGDPQVLIKGGVAMELRLALGGRATRDLDATLRAPAEPEQIEALVRAALGARPVEGRVSFDVRAAQPLGDSGAVRFDVRVFWKGSPLSKVRLEVSGADGGELDWEAVPALNLAGQFGFEAVVEVPCPPLRVQIAQKLHAVTDPRPDNDRFRDLIDLILLDELDERDSDAALAAACRQVFAERERHRWPPRLAVRPGWGEGYRALARGIGFPLASVDEAVARVAAMIARLEAAG